MKILNVNCTIDKKTGGGTAERTLKMTKSLNAAGLDCSILSLDISHENRSSIIDNTKTILLPCILKRFYFPSLSKKSVTSIRDAVKSADITHLMSHWTVINAIVYFYLKRYRKPYVVSPAGSMVIFGRTKTLKKLYNFIIGKAIIKNASACIAITKNEIKQFEGFGVEKKKIVLIPNGVSCCDFETKRNLDFRRQFNLPQKPFILFLGRLNLIKGPDLLIEAYIKAKARLRDYTLVFAGPDEGMQNDLQKRVVENGLESNVRFVGYLNQEQKSRAYIDSAFVAIPSRHEAMSIVVLEAGVVKRPVLLTDKCGLDEVETCGGGIIVQPTAESISEGLLKMTQKLETTNDQMGENLYQFIINNYTWKNIANRFISLYFEIQSRS